MSKEVRVCLSLIQIALMLLSVVSFSAILNSGVVSGQGDDENTDASLQEISDVEGPNDLGNTNQPTGGSSILSRQLGITDAPKNIGVQEHFWGWYTGGFADAIMSGLMWAGVIYGTFLTFGEMFGIKGETLKTVAQSASIGALFGRGVSVLVGDKGALKGWFSKSWLGEHFTAGQFSALVGGGVALAMFISKYKKQETKIVKFDCKPWEPPCSLLKA